MDSYGRIALARLKTMAPEEWVQKYGAPLCHHYDAHEKAVAASTLSVKAAGRDIRPCYNFVGEIATAIRRFKHSTGWQSGSQKRLQPTRERWAAAIQLAAVCASACALFSAAKGRKTRVSSKGSWKVMWNGNEWVEVDGGTPAPFMVELGAETGREILDESQIRKVDDWHKKMRDILLEMQPGDFGVEEFLEREGRIRKAQSESAEVDAWIQTLEEQNDKGKGTCDQRDG